MTQKTEVGQLVQVMNEKGNWVYGYVQDIFDDFYVVKKQDGRKMSMFTDKEKEDKVNKLTKERDPNEYYMATFVIRDGKRVMAKRKTSFFGLIKGNYLPEPPTRK